ncbi:hypothetical protein RE432_08170 [Pusillimonas sp. SM2304]|uniref:hypothetical protein n=1 Tax=Pusillimonas sp. SM2304 TaxID=3073241 RepID=UPI0028771E17|nr:hypothetical protein [Pusillimonas sp. SM2304]MDS1140409.1 hypothetical protein [Pusillimonas sp. SM2304]
MAAEQNSRFPETIDDLKNRRQSDSSKDAAPAKSAPRSQGQRGEDEKPPGEDPRVNISTADDIDIEPDEAEQRDEPAPPPIIPPKKTE